MGECLPTWQIRTVWFVVSLGAENRIPSHVSVFASSPLTRGFPNKNSAQCASSFLYTHSPAALQSQSWP